MNLEFRVKGWCGINFVFLNYVIFMLADGAG